MGKTMIARVIILLAIVLVASGCSREQRREIHAETVPHPTSRNVSSKGGEVIPDTARIDRVADVVRDPTRDSLPADPHLAEQIVRGFHIVRDTRKHAAKYVGNDFDCANCHLNVGQRERGLPYVGVAATFPQYRSREGRLISLEDRIRSCFERSLNGTPPPFDAPELLSVAAYITWLSRGTEIGGPRKWSGKNTIAGEHLLPIEKLDVGRGETLYLEKCVLCHGKDGQGVDLAIAKAGPLWGPRSWNDGAGVSRVYTLAGFIRYAMPLTNPGSLSDEDAQHIAAFIDSHTRPAFAHKRKDYPNGDTPIDAVYYPRYSKNPLMAERGR
jgi:thiosulfate dehydrogenase